MVLDDGTSQLTDRLVVNGDTSGTTRVFVDNDGGRGSFTDDVSPHGIRIIEVSGESNGHFELGAPVEVGAFRYDLQQADGQNWYLQSNGPSCSVVIVSRVPHSLRHMGSQLTSSWNERSGGLIEPGAEAHAFATEPRYAVPPPDFENSGSQTGIWSRAIGASSKSSTRLRGTSSNDFVSHEESLWAMQLGFDALARPMQSGDMYAGAFFHYGEAATEGINETMGGSSVGSYEMDGFGAGASLTYLSESGLYLDGVATLTQYNLDLNTALGAIGSSSADVWTLSGEAGRQFVFDDGFSVTPQMQIVYQYLDIEQISLSDGTHVAGIINESLTSQFGAKAEFSPDVGLRIYGEAMVSYEFLDAPQTWIDGETFSADYGDARYQVDMGFQWVKGTDSMLWAEAGYSDSFAQTDNQLWTFTAGLKLLH